MSNLEALQSFKAIEVCVTTRQIGFGTVHFFKYLNQFNKVPSVHANKDNGIYQMYRVNLAVLQVKLMIVQRGIITAIQVGGDSFADLPDNANLVATVQPLTLMPDPISSVVNAVGHVRTNDRLYVPKIGRDNFTKANNFIPQAEQVTFQNLRHVVESLANNATPVDYRRKFYRNNPIPGAIWQGVPNNPILMNPDDIMPANYTVANLADDIGEMWDKLNFLNRKAPKYYSHTILNKLEGRKSMLVCNGQGNLRIIDRNAGEQLPDYYVRMKIEGDVDDYYNLEKLTPMEQIDGCLQLLGEQPSSLNLVYPVYANRGRTCCCQLCPCRYRSILNMKYL